MNCEDFGALDSHCCMTELNDQNPQQYNCLHPHSTNLTHFLYHTKNHTELKNYLYKSHLLTLVLFFSRYLQ